MRKEEDKMAAYIHTRSSFGSSFDFHAGLNFDMPHRKHSATTLEEYNYNNNYHMFNDESNLSNKHSGNVDVLRSISQNYQQQTSPNGPANNFTFNHNVTHVNLINNRFQIDIPAAHQYNNNTSTHDFPMSDSTTAMGMNISPVSHHTTNNQFSRSSPNNAVVSRLNSASSYTTSNHGESYSPPQQMMNNQSPNDQFMSMYHSSQGYNHSTMKPSPTEYNIPSLTKFPSPDHPLPITSPIKSNEEYQNSLYHGYNEQTNLMNNVNGSISNSMPNNLSRVPPIFTQPSENKHRDTDVEQVNDAQKCKNTIEGTKTSVRRFKRWYKERYNKEIDMNSVNSYNAPELLKDFFLDIRDTRPGRVGNEYEPVTLTTYRNGLRRYFLYRKCPPAPDNFDLTDKTFDIVNRHLVTKRDDLKRKGKGNHPNAIESITAEQLEKMWASGAIGTHAPRPLLRLQWWYNTVYHGVRGRMAHHDLTTEDFAISRAMDGKILMEYTKNGQNDPASISPKLEPPKKKKFKGVVKETDGGERDPIRAFEIYKAHRPEGISSFYLTPKHKPKGNVWFNKVPMGKNSIGRIMREIKAIAGI
uniref:WegA-I protein n=1 Tax=Clytia hemisphaerica TaxID=252671 RepID=A0A069DMM2_9CNID